MGKVAQLIPKLARILDEHGNVIIGIGIRVAARANRTRSRVRRGSQIHRSRHAGSGPARDHRLALWTRCCPLEHRTVQTASAGSAGMGLAVS
jgi:hypothetical protein